MLSVPSDSKNSGLRRAIGTNDTALSSIFSLVSGKIKISGFRSHFGLKIDRSSEQNESNSSFLSANWMQKDQINGIQPMERAKPMTVNRHFVLFFSDQFSRSDCWKAENHLKP